MIVIFVTIAGRPLPDPGFLDDYEFDTFVNTKTTTTEMQETTTITTTSTGATTTTSTESKPATTTIVSEENTTTDEDVGVNEEFKVDKCTLLIKPSIFRMIDEMLEERFVKLGVKLEKLENLIFMFKETTKNEQTTTTIQTRTTTPTIPETTSTISSITTVKDEYYDLFGIDDNDFDFFDNMGVKKEKEMELETGKKAWFENIYIMIGISLLSIGLIIIVIVVIVCCIRKKGNIVKKDTEKKTDELEMDELKNAEEKDEEKKKESGCIVCCIRKKENIVEKEKEKKTAELKNDEENDVEKKIESDRIDVSDIIDIDEIEAMAAKEEVDLGMKVSAKQAEFDAKIKLIDEKLRQNKEKRSLFLASKK
jgi:hypothetical protein